MFMSKDLHQLRCQPSPRLSPRHFGEPTNRDRAWRIVYEPRRLQWNCPYSFEELVKLLLCSPKAPLKTSPELFFWGKPTDCVSEHATVMCPSATVYLDRYKETRPNKDYFDLASNPDHVCRTETVDGALMTLTTNTRIWRLRFTSYCVLRDVHVSMLVLREMNTWS